MSAHDEQQAKILALRNKYDSAVMALAELHPAASEVRADTLAHDIECIWQELLAALRRASPETGWQPIATAPKTREILVFDEGAITISVWDEHAKGWWEPSSECVIDPPPTHWQPIPPPPETQEAE